MNTNILNNSKPSWKDAAIIALILMVGLYATMFLPTWTFPMIKGESERFIYETARFLMQSFITNFISLAGLTYATKKKKE